MGKYDRTVKRLIKTINGVAPACYVENVIIDLLKTDDIYGAVEIAKKINPGLQFASAFANELLTADTEFIMDESFIVMKKIAKENITESEADIMLRRYIGPDGKNQARARSAPKEILQASSRETMMHFFECTIEDQTVCNIDYARKFWPYLKGKI